jgi:hypothetical protein
MFILALSVGVVDASDNRLSLSIASYHITNDYMPDNIVSYNQNNLGLSFEHKLNDNIYIALGLYDNSIYNTSYHAGILLVKQYDNIEIGSNIGLVTGYTNKAIPYARPYIQYKNVRFGYIPKIDSIRTEHVLTLEYIWEL